LLVHLHRYPIDSRTRLPLLSPKRTFKRGPINMMQQCSELDLVGPMGRRIHPREAWRQGSPALCPAPRIPTWVLPGLVPSLHASRFLRRLHQYYGPVRLPTSARMTASDFPRRPPPPETNPAAPVGPLMFRCLPSMRDLAFDPGGAIPTRIASVHMLPSCTGTHSASATFILSRFNPTPHMASVYTSDLALPRRPQDSIPICPLRL